MHPAPSARTATTFRGEAGGEPAPVDRAASRYAPGVGSGARLGSVGAIILIYIGMAALIALTGTIVTHPVRQTSLKVFSVPPPSEPPPAVPDKVEPAPTPPRPADPVVVVPVPVVVTPAPVRAVAPSQPVVATTSAKATTDSPPIAVAAATSTAPVFVANPVCTIAAPAYPTRAKRLQQTGKVRVAVTITPDGKIGSQSVRNSSGYDALDGAAMATVRNGRCRPSADGRSIASVLTVAFTLGQ